MIQPLTLLTVADNSGASIVQCIKVLGRSGRSSGFIGDFIVVSVKSLKTKGNIKVKKKEICLGLIVRQRSKKKCRDGRIFNFNDNSVILFNRNYKPFGTRVFGPIPIGLRGFRNFKVILTATQFV